MRCDDTALLGSLEHLLKSEFAYLNSLTPSQGDQLSKRSNTEAQQVKKRQQKLLKKINEKLQTEGQDQDESYQVDNFNGIPNPNFPQQHQNI